jgi:hypothetical protein
MAGLAALALGPASSAEARTDTFTGIVAEQVFAWDGERRDRELARIASAGVQVIRQPLRWAEIERTRGRYDFSRWDGYVAALARHGIQLLPVLTDPPPFRSAAPGSGAARGLYPPRRARDMAAFAGRAARRYGPGGSFWRANPELPEAPIRSWQVWNEPNLPVYWRPRPRAGGYARLLAEVARGLRKVDPRVEVVSAGIPQSTMRGSVPQLTYIRQLYAAGAGRNFDMLGIHSYTDTHPRLVRQLEGIRRTVRRARDDAPLWITEIGWATQGPGVRYTPGPEGQARRIEQAFDLVRSRRQSLGIRGLVYYMWQDAPPYPGFRDFWGLHTGLHDINGAEKPGMAVFRDQALTFSLRAACAARGC